MEAMASMEGQMWLWCAGEACCCRSGCGVRLWPYRCGMRFWYTDAVGLNVGQYKYRCRFGMPSGVLEHNCTPT